MGLALISILLITVQVFGQTTNEAVKDFAGCYRLLPISPIGHPHDFPREIQLTTKSFSGNSWYVVRNLDSVSSAHWPFSFWIPDHQRLEISWGTGFVGYDAKLNEVDGWLIGDRRLIGTVQFWSDDGEPSSPTQVEARRFDCRKLPKSR